MNKEELIDALRDIINHTEEDSDYNLDDIVFDLNELTKDL